MSQTVPAIQTVGQNALYMTTTITQTKRPEKKKKKKKHHFQCWGLAAWAPTRIEGHQGAAKTRYTWQGHGLVAEPFRHVHDCNKIHEASQFIVVYCNFHPFSNFYLNSIPSSILAARIAMKSSLPVLTSKLIHDASAG